MTQLEEAMLPLSQSGLFSNHIAWTLARNLGLSWPPPNSELCWQTSPDPAWANAASTPGETSWASWICTIRCHRYPSTLSTVTCRGSDYWQRGNILDFFRGIKWISVWPKWPLTRMGGWAGSPNEKQDIQKGSDLVFTGELPQGVPSSQCCMC